MRIIAGKFRGRKLKSPTGLKTRPTSDRLRETLFNILQPRISENTRFLDLCAGTGAVGIEALSRGASFTGFVDISRKVCGVLEHNLDALSIPEEQTEIFNEPAESFLVKKQSTAWDIIYYDPPYQSDYSKVLKIIAASQSTILNDESLLIVEHDTKTNLPDEVGALRRWRIVKQGDSCLSFYELE